MADLSGLLEGISANEPCGENLEYDALRVTLDTDILGTPENQFTGEKAQPPNWRDIEKQSLALLQRSRDLQVILYFIRSQIPLQGWLGFRDGLAFLHQSLVRHWDTIHPQLDPDDDLDPTIRVNIIEDLNHFEFVLRPLMMAYLVESRSVGRFCLRDLQYATDKIETPADVTKPDINVIRAAFLDVDSVALNATRQAVTDSIKLAEQVEDFVMDQVGASQAPSLSALKSLLKETAYDLQQFAGIDASHEYDAVVDVDVSTDNADVSIPKAKTISGAIESRQDVLRMLDLICQYYADHEPSSPVPILLRRARYLVTADFMEIVHNLIPGGLSQIETIKGPDTLSQ